MGCNAATARRLLQATASSVAPGQGMVTAAILALRVTLASTQSNSSEPGEGQLTTTNAISKNPLQLPTETAAAITNKPQPDDGNNSEDWDPFGASPDFWQTIFPAMLAAGAICLVLCIGGCCLLECYVWSKRREAKIRAREARVAQPEVVRVRPARQNRRQQPHPAWNESLTNQAHGPQAGYDMQANMPPQVGYNASMQAKALPVGNQRNNTQVLDAMSSVVPAPTPTEFPVGAAGHPPVGITLSMDGPNRISLNFHALGGEAPAASAMTPLPTAGRQRTASE